MMKHSNLSWTLVLEPPPHAPAYNGFMFTPILREGASNFKEELRSAISSKAKLLQILLIDEDKAGYFNEAEDSVIQIIPVQDYSIKRMFNRVEVGLLSGSKSTTKVIEVIDERGNSLFVYGYPDKAVVTKDPRYSRK